MRRIIMLFLAVTFNCGSKFASATSLREEETGMAKGFKIVNTKPSTRKIKNKLGGTKVVYVKPHQNVRKKRK
jgi:hypothetical protein